MMDRFKYAGICTTNMRMVMVVLAAILLLPLVSAQTGDVLGITATDCGINDIAYLCQEEVTFSCHVYSNDAVDITTMTFIARIYEGLNFDGPGVEYLALESDLTEDSTYGNNITFNVSVPWRWPEYQDGELLVLRLDGVIIEDSNGNRCVATDNTEEGCVVTFVDELSASCSSDPTCSRTAEAYNGGCTEDFFCQVTTQEICTSSDTLRIIRTPNIYCPDQTVDEDTIPGGCDYCTPNWVSGVLTCDVAYPGAPGFASSTFLDANNCCAETGRLLDCQEPSGSDEDIPCQLGHWTQGLSEASSSSWNRHSASMASTMSRYSKSTDDDLILADGLVVGPLIWDFDENGVNDIGLFTTKLGGTFELFSPLLAKTLNVPILCGASRCEPVGTGSVLGYYYYNGQRISGKIKGMAVLAEHSSTGDHLVWSTGYIAGTGFLNTFSLDLDREVSGKGIACMNTNNSVDGTDYCFFTTAQNELWRVDMVSGADTQVYPLQLANVTNSTFTSVGASRYADVKPTFVLTSDRWGGNPDRVVFPIEDYGQTYIASCDVLMDDCTAIALDAQVLLSEVSSVAVISDVRGDGDTLVVTTRFEN